MRYLHAGLTIANLDRSTRFYGELLGLCQVPRPDLGFPGAWYAMGGGELHLIAPLEGQTAGDPTGPFAGRVRHLAFEVPSWETVVARLRTEGVPVRDAAPSPGRPRRVFVKDPDGNVLELVDVAGEVAELRARDVAELTA